MLTGLGSVEAIKPAERIFRVIGDSKISRYTFFLLSHPQLLTHNIRALISLQRQC